MKINYKNLGWWTIGIIGFFAMSELIKMMPRNESKVVDTILLIIVGILLIYAFIKTVFQKEEKHHG